jgi:hypothetical protein
MPYSPKNNPGSTLEELREYVIRELEELSRAFLIFDLIKLKTWHAEPTRLYDGLVVYADGTDWNPGSGEGIYAYYNSGWNKL